MGDQVAMTIMEQKGLFIFFLVLAFLFPIRDGAGQKGSFKEKIISPFRAKVPKEWGEKVTGVKTRLNTEEKVLALTFDACGGPGGKGFDEKLINFLEREKISVTLFISGKWIDANQEIFLNLAKNPLFEIESHGLNHKPCSVNGRSAYGMRGTKSVEEIFDEIEENALKIQSLTGRKPKYYRPATATCDEICVEIANALGYEVVTFSVLGDAGATYSKDQARAALLRAPPASIVLMHMNHPESQTAEGVIEAIPELKKRGVRFVKLEEYGLK
jgi:peptidoglycan/xylan/chitin deacetylase (PgdA/CDA1 family)